MASKKHRKRIKRQHEHKLNLRVYQILDFGRVPNPIEWVKGLGKTKSVKIARYTQTVGRGKRVFLVSTNKEVKS